MDDRCLNHLSPTVNRPTKSGRLRSLASRQLNGEAREHADHVVLLGDADRPDLGGHIVRSIRLHAAGFTTSMPSMDADILTLLQLIHQKQRLGRLTIT